jgi:hypothetical protein
MAKLPVIGKIVERPPGLLNFHVSDTAPVVRSIVQPDGGVLPLAVEKSSFRK